MIRQIALLLSFLLVYSAPAGLLASTAPPAEPGGDYPVPTGAAPGGSTPERSSAWNGLPSTAQQQYVDTFWNQIVPQALQHAGAKEAAAEPPAPANPLLGGAVTRPATARTTRTVAELVPAKDAPPPPAPALPSCPEPAAGICECMPIAGAADPGEPVEAVQIVATPASGSAPLTVFFDVQWSQPISSYFWDFGDGGTSFSPSPSHTYTSGGTRTVTVTVTHALWCSSFWDSTTITVGAPAPTLPDHDADGLPDQFEDDLAFAFRPIYHVSAGERAGTGFADFGDFVPQTPTQVYGSVPARNHVRVKPLGFTWVNGQYSGVLQIDYFTMWNRDDGLLVSNACIFLTGGVAGFLEPVVAFAHSLDNERSAVLVAAPAAGGGYNTSPGAYKAYEYYTAAHEDTFNDKSLYFWFSSPVPAYTSVRLGLTLSKHATYPFNADGLPLAPAWVIYSTYDFIFWLYWTGQIDFWDYLIYSYIADVVFYVCWVEHFIEQGGTLPGASKNIGDVGHAINGSGFIETTALRNKLNKVLWYLN